VTKWGWSYLVWGAWALLFLVLEIPGNWRWVPWVTLSETSQRLEDLSTPVRIGAFALLIMLVAHIVFRGGFLRASAFGLVVAIAAHLVNKHWP
jgi:hypothetical protein